MPPDGWVNLSLREQMIDDLDEARGEFSRSEYIERALDHWFQAHADDMACLPSAN